MTATQTADLDSRLRELKTAWSTADTENNDIVASAKNEDGTLLIDNDRRAAFQKNLGTMREIRTEMEMLEEQKSLNDWGRQPANESVAMAAEAQAAGEKAAKAVAREFKSLGQMFTESDEFKQLVQSGGGNMPIPWTYRGDDMGAKWARSQEQKDVYSATPSGGPPLGFKPLYRDDIVVQAFRKVRVRDLFPVQSTTAAVIEFFRVTGFVAANAASVVPERDGNAFGLAPQTKLAFQGAQAPVRMIAHWEAAHRNVLNDVPQLQGIIDTELLYGLRLAEDNQILNGTGTGEDLAGLMLAGNGAQTYTRGSVPNDTNADDVRRAATKAILAYYEPTGVVMNPTDWEGIETLKDSTHAYIIAIAVAVGAEQRIWRLPVVDTPAMSAGSFLVGSFGLGAKLFDREEGSIRVAEQHADFFLRQAIVIQAEERLALTLPRPESFVQGTFGD